MKFSEWVILLIVSIFVNLFIYYFYDRKTDKPNESSKIDTVNVQCSCVIDTLCYIGNVPEIDIMKYRPIDSVYFVQYYSVSKSPVVYKMHINLHKRKE